MTLAKRGKLRDLGIEIRKEKKDQKRKGGKRGRGFNFETKTKNEIPLKNCVR